MKRVRYSSYASQEVQARARAAVRGTTAATGTDYTLADFTEDALLAWAERLEATYHDGLPWPSRPGRLPAGRRVTKE